MRKGLYTFVMFWAVLVIARNVIFIGIVLVLGLTDTTVSASAESNIDIMINVLSVLLATAAGYIYYNRGFDRFMEIWKRSQSR